MDAGGRMTLRFIVGPMVVEQVHAGGDDYISWSLTQKVYGLQVAEDVAIAPDGTQFDPRTLEVDEHGIARAAPK